MATEDRSGVAASRSARVTRPTGTVTFLFTDIEGSTRLLEQLRGRYAEVLADHRGIMRDAFEEWHGHEIDTQGDSFFVAFARASDALRCAIDAQRAITAWNWPDDLDVRVRMGIHTGEPVVAAVGYVGMDVHRAARIASTGHGGQILMSGTTHDLVADELPADIRLQDLGTHSLKDIKTEIRLFQVTAAGLSDRFRAADHRRRANPNRPRAIRPTAGWRHSRNPMPRSSSDASRRSTSWSTVSFTRDSWQSSAHLGAARVRSFAPGSCLTLAGEAALASSAAQPHRTPIRGSCRGG